MISSKRKLDLKDLHDLGKEFLNKIFQEFLNNNIIKTFSRNTSLGAVFAEGFNRTFKFLLERPIFENCDGNWIDVLPTITKQYTNRIQSSTKLMPIQASLKKVEGFVYRNILDERMKIKPKFQINDLVGTAGLKKTFSKWDITNWSYKLYKITETVNDTIPSYHIDNLLER